MASLNFLSWLRFALALACYATLSGCDISTLVQPPWPSGEALRKFDFQHIASDPTIQAMDQIAYYYGATAGCDFDYEHDPTFAKLWDARAGKAIGAVGDAARGAILAEVKRQHPKDAGGLDVAERISWGRMDAEVKLGSAALKASGCNQMKEPARRAMLAVTELGYKLLQNGVMPQQTRARP